MDTMPMIWQAPERFRSHKTDVINWLRLHEAEIENILNRRGALLIRGFYQLNNRTDFENAILGFAPFSAMNREYHFCLDPSESTTLLPTHLTLQTADILAVDKIVMKSNRPLEDEDLLQRLMSPQLLF